MRDISSKQITLRTAKAVGLIFCSSATIDLIKNESLPKGNLFDVARAAGFIAAKLTPQLLPHCHPVQIDGMDMAFEFLNQATHSEFFDVAVFSKTGIVITGHVKSIGRTGVEMEVLTAISVAALNIYDMLKPVDNALEIGGIKLLDKAGGKSESRKYFTTSPVCAVFVCSDSAAAGKREDKSGLTVKSMLESAGATVKYYAILPEEKVQIQSKIMDCVNEDIHFIFTVGGTGLGPGDLTVEAVKEILERDADGITEAMRNFGQQRTPRAMMSRAVAGSIASTLIVALPGSSNGARESLEAILPGVFYARKMLRGGGQSYS